MLFISHYLLCDNNNPDKINVLQVQNGLIEQNIFLFENKYFIIISNFFYSLSTQTN
jgi:hypothetical protein